jgi:hypothetical protein
MDLQTVALVATIVSGVGAVGAAFVALARFVRPRIARGRYRKDGTLLQRPGHPAVFVVMDGQRYAIPDEETFNDLGYDWGEIEHVPQSVIDGIPYGGELPGRAKGRKEPDTLASEGSVRAHSGAHLRVLVQPQRVARGDRVSLMLFGTRGGGLATEYECVVTPPHGTPWHCPLGEAPTRDVLTFPDDFPGGDTGAPGHYKVGLYVSEFLLTVSAMLAPQPFFETSFEVTEDSADD